MTQRRIAPTLFALAALAACALLALPLHPADTPAPGGGDSASSETPAETPAEAPEKTGRSREELEQELEEFTPSESLPADSAISFPVDI